MFSVTSVSHGDVTHKLDDGQDFCFRFRFIQ